MGRLDNGFFEKDILDIRNEMLGKIIVVNDNGIYFRYAITEFEIYRGEEDTACHASKGKTNRTEIMYRKGGVLYVYLIYGMYWMMNIVTGPKEHPQAILIRGIEGVSGPGRVGKKLQLDKSYNGEDLSNSNRIWIEDAPVIEQFISSPRIGIDYATKEWQEKKWRFEIKKTDTN